MAFLGDKETTQRRREAWYWWSVSTELHVALRQTPDAPIVADMFDEVDMLAEMSDWPALKRICRRTLERRPVVAVA